MLQNSKAVGPMLVHWFICNFSASTCLDSIAHFVIFQIIIFFNVKSIIRNSQANFDIQLHLVYYCNRLQCSLSNFQYAFLYTNHTSVNYIECAFFIKYNYQYLKEENKEIKIRLNFKDTSKIFLACLKYDSCKICINLIINESVVYSAPFRNILFHSYYESQFPKPQVLLFCFHS